MKFAVLDVETTGLNPVNDRVIELGIVFMDDGEIVGSENFIFNPERKLSSKIKQLTGLTDAELEDAPYFEVFAEQIAHLTRDRIVVGHHVSFDYAFLRNEMKLSGVRFSRNTLCTAELSRYLFPQATSHSLAAATRRAGIINKRPHRAMPDALATADLLSFMLQKLPEGFVKALFRNQKQTTTIPEHLKQFVREKLPENAGIYYFVGRNGKPIYIGKAVNLRSRVLSHFRGEGNSLRILSLGARIKEIKYLLTGNESLATLIEDHEIRHYWPELNQAQKQPTKRFGIVYYQDQEGYWRLGITNGGKQHYMISSFHRYYLASGQVRFLAEHYGLDPAKCGLQKPANISKESHNRNFEKLIKDLQNKTIEAFFDAGRDAGERSYILIINGQYKGYGFIPSAQNVTAENLLENLVLQRTSITTESIILKIKEDREADFKQDLSGIQA